MIRTRLVWLGLGFSVTGAAISQFIWRDLWVDRYALLSDVRSTTNPLTNHTPLSIIFNSKWVFLFLFLFFWVGEKT